MKVQLKTINLILIFPLLLLLGCSGESEEPDPTVTAIQNNIIGSWVSTDVTDTTEGTWTFLPDGTFVDTQGANFEYEIHQISDFYYITFKADDLNIEPSDELKEELENSLGDTDFIPIYQVTMPSAGSLIIEPATKLYGSESYFGFTFQTYVLRRQ